MCLHIAQVSAQCHLRGLLQYLWLTSPLSRFLRNTFLDKTLLHLGRPAGPLTALLPSLLLRSSHTSEFHVTRAHAFCYVVFHSCMYSWTFHHLVLPNFSLYISIWHGIILYVLLHSTQYLRESSILMSVPPAVYSFFFRFMYYSKTRPHFIHPATEEHVDFPRSLLLWTMILWISFYMFWSQWDSL